MLKNLLWKEYQENKWKLVFCLTVSMAFTVLLFRMRLIPDYANTIAISTAQLFIVPIIFAMDIFSGEMSNRTIYLLFKIPVERWKIFLSKYLAAASGMALVFVLNAVLIEIMSQGREADIGFLLKQNLAFGVCAEIIFAWFCVFACQSRSEAGSITALFAVMIGWGIVMLWSSVCKVVWMLHFIPFTIIPLTMLGTYTIKYDQFIFAQLFAFSTALIIAGYRFTRIRRYL